MKLDLINSVNDRQYIMNAENENKINLVELLKKYIREEISKLKNKDDSVKLECVYPEILNEVLGYNDEPYDLNGYDCDYWMTIGSYNIFGTMRFGTAIVTLNQDLK